MKNPRDENELIRRIERRFPALKSKVLRLRLGDDAALWPPRPGYETILTCDWFLEDSHFIRGEHPADAVGWKCLARAVSDVAAMGGEPRCFLLSLALPVELTGKWLDGFLRGLRRAAQALRCELAGGDTTRQERVSINIAVIGEVKRGRAVLRSGARPGDLVFVSGIPGEAALGLELLKEAGSTQRRARGALQKHLYPEPRIPLGQLLANEGLASAMIDVSDGLSSDLARLCEASGVGAVIAPGALPRLKGISEAKAAQLALNGGDDYELLFTVKPQERRHLKKSLRTFNKIPVSFIGEITKGTKLRMVNAEGTTEELLQSGWDPFRNR
jgi:thiamine-monophosphate kinase